MENIDFASNGIEELKNADGEIQELRFKIRFLSLFGSFIKNLFLFIVICVAIIFSLFTLYSVPFFLMIIILILNKQTVVVKKEAFFIKNSIPIFPSKEISILELERLAVKRVETTIRNKSSPSKAVNFQLYAIFKNKPAKKIFSTMNPILVDQMDSKIEKLLNIKDNTNNGQLEKISKTHYQNKIESDYKQNILLEEKEKTLSKNKSFKKNLQVEKPTRSFPFTVSSNLINLKITHFYRKSGDSIFITFIVGLVFTATGILIPLFDKPENTFIIICAIIGFPIMILGLSNIFNKRYINASKSKINYYTNPISIRKEKEILKSQITNLEVIFSGQQTNGVPSYNIVVKTKDGKTHKLIKYVFNELALKDLVNEINHHMNLKA
tara:strand:+ start:1000 stop:2142 length:1143 start_codon:yes stop_codon:yes gene_type:complete